MKEDAGGAGASAGGGGGGHVTTKIRLTATVAGGRRGEERYTCLVTLGLLNITATTPAPLHYHRTFLSLLSIILVAGPRLISINHRIITVISAILPTGPYCLWVE